MRWILFLILLTAAVEKSTANNIRIQKVWLSDTNRVGKTVQINFNISWENSWRDSINWDAAWVFFKFREPKDSSWNWRHGTLSKTGNNGGTGTPAMKFSVPDDVKGAFYYRQERGSGHIQQKDVKLLWNYGADGVTLIDSVEIKLFAAEMVYVPEGQFCIGQGSGIGTYAEQGAFTTKTPPKHYVTVREGWTPVFINYTGGLDNQGVIDIGDFNIKNGIRVSGLNGIDFNNDKIADFPDFPIGYRAFYCMKYKVTQGQYADFLNTLSIRPTDPANPVHYWASVTYLDSYYRKSVPANSRHTIVHASNYEEGTTVKRHNVSRPDRAYGRTTDPAMIFGFADWSGLRPMSELEYEKACRGPLPPTVLGSLFDINIYSPSVSIKGPEDGTEYFVDGSNNFARGNPVNGPWSGGDNNGNVKGLYRVGMLANDTTSRAFAGASYYGIMDLANNGHECTLTIRWDYGRKNSSYKRHGDGLMEVVGGSLGQEFVPSWGPINVDQIWLQCFILKGGAVASVLQLRNGPGENADIMGFRCVRTAPAE